MSKVTAGVTLLFIGVITVTGHVTGFSTGVAKLLSLFLRFLALPGNVATLVAVVARYKRKGIANISSGNNDDSRKD